MLGSPARLAPPPSPRCAGRAANAACSRIAAGVFAASWNQWAPRATASGTAFSAVPLNQQGLLSLPGRTELHRARGEGEKGQTSGAHCSPYHPAAPPGPGPVTRAAGFLLGVSPCPLQHHDARPWLSAVASSLALLLSSPFCPSSLSPPCLTLQTVVTRSGGQSQRPQRPHHGGRQNSSRSPPAAS